MSYVIRLLNWQKPLRRVNQFQMKKKMMEEESNKRLLIQLYRNVVLNRRYRFSVFLNDFVSLYGERLEFLQILNKHMNNEYDRNCSPPENSLIFLDIFLLLQEMKLTKLFFVYSQSCDEMLIEEIRKEQNFANGDLRLFKALTEFGEKFKNSTNDSRK